MTSRTPIDSARLSARAQGAAEQEKCDILFVVNELRSFMSHRLPIAQEAIRQGLAVAVAAPPSALRVVVEDLGIRVHEVSVRRGRSSVLAELRGFWVLLSLYRSVRPTLVHHVTLKPVLVGSLAARLAKVPAVVNAVAGLGYTFMADGLKAALVRRVVTRWLRVALSHGNSRTIFQNPDDVKQFLSAGIIHEDACVLIRGAGVDLNKFAATPIPSGTPLVILPARMLRDKGVREFVKAASLVRDRGVAARFALVGRLDPANPTSLTEVEVRQLVLEAGIEWWGDRQDMPEVIQQATAVVLPSYREGFPKVLLEAAGVGRPVITTDVPGCREAVEEGVTGTLVPAKDPQALAEAIVDLLADKQRLKSMGTRARARVEGEFSQEDVARRTVALYSDLMLRVAL